MFIYDYIYYKLYSSARFLIEHTTKDISAIHWLPMWFLGVIEGTFVLGFLSDLSKAYDFHLHRIYGGLIVAFFGIINAAYFLINKRWLKIYNHYSKKDNNRVLSVVSSTLIWVMTIGAFYGSVFAIPDYKLNEKRKQERELQYKQNIIEMKYEQEFNTRLEQCDRMVFEGFNWEKSREIAAWIEKRKYDKEKLDSLEIKSGSKYIYEIAGYKEADWTTDTTAIRGFWVLDDRGRIITPFMPNPVFRPLNWPEEWD